jgi:hypothetical protein
MAHNTKEEKYGYCIDTELLSLLSLFYMQPGQLRLYSGWPTGWTAGFRFPAGARDSSCLHSLQTRSVAHSASYTMGTGGKAEEARSLTHLRLAPRLRMVELYLHSHTSS